MLRTVDRQGALRAAGTEALPPLTAADVMHAREVAAFLRVPLSTVMQWARQGEIPAHKRGRRWLFLRPEVDAWLRAPDGRD